MSANHIGTGKGLLIILGTVAFFVWYAGSGGSSDSEASPQPVAKPAAPTYQVWKYTTSKDEMSGKVASYSSLRSETRFELGPPYQGLQRATLTLREHPRHGFDSVITIGKGQLQCDLFDGCKLQVRFNDGQPQQWTFLEPESHDSTVLFLRDGQQFARKVASSERIRVELKFFQQPPVVVTFRTKGLNEGVSGL